MLISQTSNLPFDVDSAKCSQTSALKELASFAAQEHDAIRSVFQQMLPLQVDDKLGSIRIRLEAKLLCEKTELNVGFVTANS